MTNGGQNKVDFALWATVAVTQVLVGFLGILAIKSDLAGQHFKSFVAAFAILSLLGMVASGWGAVRASKASDQIARLTQDTLYAIEGSPDSHLRLHGIFQTNLGGDSEKGIMTFQFYNKSEYPMIDTSIWIGGTRNCKATPKGFGANVGDVYAGDGGELTRLKVQLSKEKENEIHFGIKARSVLLWQDFVAVWNGKGWVSDFTLYKYIGDTQEREYIKKFRHDFPFKGKRIHDDVEDKPQA